MIKKVIVMLLLLLLLLFFTFQIVPKQTKIIEIPGRNLNFSAVFPSVFAFLYVYKMEANRDSKQLNILKEAL